LKEEFFVRKNDYLTVLRDFSWCSKPKREKYTKRPQNTPNGQKNAHWT
jgi:hypothetical protein